MTAVTSPLPTGGPQRVDFTTVGADFIGQINVLKTPDVELSTSAIGATINVLLPKPFDFSGFRVAAYAGGIAAVARQARSPAAGLLISDTFANGTLGILADVDLHARGHEGEPCLHPGLGGRSFRSLPDWARST